jgi:hypothetical protein
LLSQRERLCSARSKRLRQQGIAQRRLLQTEQRRLEGLRTHFQREALRKAQITTKALQERSFGKLRALHQQLAVQKSHLDQHMQEVRARERLITQEEMHARLHTAHEKEALAHALDTLHQRETELTGKARARALVQRAALRERTLALRKREQHLNQTLAQARGVAQAERAQLLKQIATLKEQTALALAHERSLAQAHEKAVRARLHVQARKHLQAVRKQTASASRLLSDALSRQKGALRDKMRAVQVRERSLVAHDRLVQGAVTREKAQLQARFARVVTQQETMSATIQRHMREKMARQSQQHAQHYAQRLRAERQAMHQELALRLNAQRVELERQAHHQVLAQTGRIKQELEAEYTKRIQVALAQRQAELEKKKVALERHVLSQAKKLFH